MAKYRREHGSDNVDYQTSDKQLVSVTTDVSERPVRAWEDEITAYTESALDSANTRRAYLRHLRRAGGILAVHSVRDVCGADLAAYRRSVLESPLAPASQAQALAALRSFLTWSGDLGGHQLNRRTVETALKTPRWSGGARYNTVNEKEIAALLRSATTLRDRAILAVLLGGGLRVSETSGLELRDVVEDVEGNYALFIRQGKGRKDRVVPIGDEVVGAIREYLAETKRYLGTASPMFLAEDRGQLTRTGSGLSTRSISRVVQQTARTAGISAKRVSPHALRHSFAMRSIRAGGNVVALARLMGHASIKTTQRYVDHLATADLRSSIPPLPIGGRAAD